MIFSYIGDNMYQVIMFVYVLELEHNKFYVGRTDNVQARYHQHCSGSGSEWTLLHRPILLREAVETTDIFLEDTTTLRLMMIHGKSNVRGGKYANPVLTPQQNREIEVSFHSAVNGCYSCGKVGHFASSCPKEHTRVVVKGRQRDPCPRCGYTSHTRDACFARTHKNGTPIVDESKFKRFIHKIRDMFK